MLFQFSCYLRAARHTKTRILVCRVPREPGLCAIWTPLKTTRILESIVSGVADTRLPEGPRTQCLRTLLPNTIPLMGFGTRDLDYWVLELSGD